MLVSSLVAIHAFVVVGCVFCLVCSAFVVLRQDLADLGLADMARLAGQ